MRGLALSGLIAYAIMNPFLLQTNLGVSPVNYGLITLVIAGGELVGTYINSLLVMRIGYKKMMYFGITLMLIAAILLLGVSHLNIFNIISLMIPTFLVTISIGIIIPNATAGAFSEIKHSIGVAGAIYGFFQIATTIAITYLITTISHSRNRILVIFFLFWDWPVSVFTVDCRG